MARRPPLLLCESRATAGVLQGVAAEYRLRLRRTGGQVGGFLRTVLAPLLRHDGPRPVLYLGDLSLAGGQIEANTRRVLEAEVGPLDWTRAAITREQAAGLEPIRRLDHRYRPALAVECYEAEALEQARAGAGARALDALLPEPLGDVLVRERAQRDAARPGLGRLPGGSP